MKIGELARKCGLSTHTLRYYEKIGLLSYAGRSPSKHREYDESVLVWIAFIARLKSSGMRIQDMLRYAQLREQGPETASARLQLLEEHREKVLADLARLTESLSVLDQKILGYRNHLKEDSPYVQPLPVRRRKSP